MKNPVSKNVGCKTGSGVHANRAFRKMKEQKDIDKYDETEMKSIWNEMMDDAVSRKEGDV